MHKAPFALMLSAAVAAFAPALAEERRDLSAHEHGVGKLNIAFEGKVIAMELEAPGADIVGFEHPPESARDRAKVDAAIALLATPQKLFVLPKSAACTATDVDVSLVSEGEEHAESEAHADEEAHEDEAHADEAHADEEGHTEFHAEYTLSCDNPEAATRIEFAYFSVFANARELEVQMISDKGTAGYEVERDAPVLDLAGQI